DERDRRRERELRAAVQRYELLPLKEEVDRHHGPRRPRTGLAVPRDAEDLGLAAVTGQGAASRERRNVEVRGLLGPVVEPQARRDLRCMLDPHDAPPSPRLRSGPGARPDTGPRSRPLGWPFPVDPGSNPDRPDRFVKIGSASARSLPADVVRDVAGAFLARVRP